MGVVEDSPHFNEIVRLLSSGKGGTYVSNYLFDNYGEKISHATLNRYKKSNIKIDEQVHQELENIIEKTVKEETDKKVELIETAENDKQLVAKKTAEQLQSLLDVSEDYPETVKKMEEEAKDPTSKISWKDVAKEKRNAKKLYLDYMKSQETNVEVNIDNNLGTFVDDSEVMRFINESEAEEQSSK